MPHHRLYLRLALAAVLAGLASGCGGDEDRAALTVQTLAAPDSHHFHLLKAALAEFTKEHPEIEVELVGNRLKLDYLMRSIVARQAADVIEVDTGEVPFLAVRGALADLTPDCLSLYPECAPFAWVGTIEKRFYAIPWTALPTLLLYNKDAFRAAGLRDYAPPETWSELSWVAEKLTRDSDGDGKPDRYGFAFAAKNSVDLGRHFATFMVQLGRPLLAHEEGQWAFRMDTEQGRRATRFLLDLQKVAPPECVVTDNAKALEQFSSGKAAMVFASPAGLACGDDNDERFDIGVAPMPRPAEGVTQSDVSFRHFCVPAFVEGERKATALKLAAFMAGSKAQAIVAGGVDGCTPAISIRKEFIEGDAYRQPQLRAFADAIRRAGPLFPSLIWEGKCSKDWLGWIHSILVDDRRTVDEVVVIAQRKGNQALSCLYTIIGHPSLTMQLGMVTVGMLVFIVVAYVVARH